MHEKNPSDKNQEIAHQDSPKSPTIRGFEPISFFKKDKAFVFAHQKIEKLVAAVYMMTNFLQDEEPLKWSLRSLGMKLLRLNIDLVNSADSSAVRVETEIRSLVLELVSLLEVASFAGLISEMNLSILKKEFHGLLEHLEKMLHRKHNADLFAGSSFFAVEESLEISQPRTGISHREHMQMTDKASQAISLRPADLREVKDKNVQSVTSGDVSLEKDRKLKDYGSVAVKHNKRQSAIINLLKKKKEIMVRDVAEVVHDCSEKTLQRELLSLVSEGVLKKTGERRWSRYSLV
jgi:hypothetical protein